MPTARSLMAALALAFTAVSCSDDKGPTAPTDGSKLGDKEVTQPEFAKAGTGDLIFTTSQALGRGVTLTSVEVTRFALDAQNQLTVSGILTLTRGGETFTQAFNNVAATLTSNGVCTILVLDLGPLHIDLLGLVIDLSPVLLTITAEQGPGNLLGNLLCALVGLLDDGGPLADILDLIRNINRLLG